jgi:hypothetical protein
MRAKGFLLLGALSPLVQGCSVVSFAPPRVDMVNIHKDDGRGEWYCKSRKVSDKAPVAVGGKVTEITPDFNGANQLIDNFLISYRCAAREVANGRQYFEAPALAVALGGATAAAFNAPVAVAIATGAAVAGLNSGKAYFAPREKAPILAASVDALTCIKSEAVGLENYGTSVIGKAAEVDPKKGLDGNGAPLVAAEGTSGATVAVTASRQYFTLVEAALLSVENIAAQRLGSVGGFAPDALIGEITTLSAEVNKKDEERKATKKALEDGATKPGDGSPPPTPEAKEAAAKISAETTAIYQAAGEKSAVVPPDEALGLHPLPGSEQMRLMTTTTSQALIALPAKDESLKKLEESSKDTSKIIEIQGGKPVARLITEPEKRQVEDKAAEIGKKAAISETLLNIQSLQPKIKLCVVRAKL